MTDARCCPLHADPVPPARARVHLCRGDIDDTIEVEERPACYVPSFLPIVPEHAYMSAPSRCAHLTRLSEDVAQVTPSTDACAGCPSSAPCSKRKSPERAAALATISHAQADSSQRTYSHQKGSAQRSSASKSASPEKVDYQSSKDAYMLVYQRRPRRHAMADIVEAPPHVQQDIAQRNLDWKLSCAIWELKCVALLACPHPTRTLRARTNCLSASLPRTSRQAVAAETFDEVLAAKSAVFDQWEVASFDEVRLPPGLTSVFCAPDADPSCPLPLPARLRPAVGRPVDLGRPGPVGEAQEERQGRGFQRVRGDGQRLQRSVPSLADSSRSRPEADGPTFALPICAVGRLLRGAPQGRRRGHHDRRRRRPAAAGNCSGRRWL